MAHKNKPFNHINYCFIFIFSLLPSYTVLLITFTKLWKQSGSVFIVVTCQKNLRVEFSLAAAENYISHRIFERLLLLVQISECMCVFECVAVFHPSIGKVRAFS